MRTQTIPYIPGARRAACLIFAVILLLVPVVSALTPSVHAAAAITESVNLTNPRKNMYGNGYKWMNLENTLTLSGLHIETDSEYGMRIPDGATVILEGNNYISAASYALGCPSNVTFKGNGSLTLVAPDTGLYFYSTDDTTTARILGGTYTISSGGVGIRSDYTTLSITGGKFDIDVPAADGLAIAGRTIKVHGGKITANAPIRATLDLEIRAASLTVTADKPALSAARKLSLNDVSLSAGSDKSSLTRVDTYNGENCVTVKSAANLLGESVLFGESVPMFVDILLILALAALVAMGIALPLLRAHRRSQRALAAAAEAEAAAAEEKKQKKSRP